MEETKTGVAQAANAVPQERRKATYEELANYCSQLLQQNRQLRERIALADTDAAVRRLGFLFRVVENPGCFDHAFIEECAAEIRTALTPREDISAGGNTGKEGE